MTEPRWATATRRPRLARAGVAAAAVAVAFAALMMHGHVAGSGVANDAVAHAAAIGHEHGLAALTPRSLHSPPLSRSRGFGFAVLATAILGAACARRTVPVRRRLGAPLNAVGGLPPGRAPPLARIA
jgi:hypothetical protein